MGLRLQRLLGRFIPGAFAQRLVVGSVLLALVVITLAAFWLLGSYNQHLAKAQATTQNLVQVLDQNVADLFKEADLAVLAIKDEFEHEQRQGEDTGQLLDAFIARLHARVRRVDFLRTADAQGHIVHGTGVKPGGEGSIEDRDYFRQLRDNPDAGLVISQPVIGKLSGRWVLILARRLESPNRSFSGVAYAVIALEQFTQAFTHLDVGPEGFIALRGEDLGIIVRHPEPEGLATGIGQRFVAPGLLEHLRAGRISGSYEATSSRGVRQVLSFRKLSGFPFYVIVGLAKADALKAWRRELTQALAGVTLFLTLMGLSAWQLHRAWERQRIANETLAEALATVKTLGGMLPICSYCKKIRDDQGYWSQVEAYLHDHSEAEFTHGICPDCARVHFTEVLSRRDTG